MIILVGKRHDLAKKVLHLKIMNIFVPRFIRLKFSYWTSSLYYEDGPRVLKYIEVAVKIDCMIYLQYVSPNIEPKYSGDK